MRKLTALVFAVALVLGMASMANAQATYTWTVINTPGASLIWPNQANSANLFEADTGLLGRVVVDASDSPVLGTGANTCELAPSYDCQAGNPPVFLLPAGGAEGPIDVGGQAECNRVVVACNTLPVPSTGHAAEASHTAGLGSYSYLIIHTAAAGTNPSGKGVSFFAGSFVIEQQPYKCNDCPAGGFGKDINDQIALDNTGPGAVVQSQAVTLWITQGTSPFGHALISLSTAAGEGAGAGKLSACGTGVVFQDLVTDLCVDGLDAGTGNFTIPDQKVVAHTYSVNMSQHASLANPGACNPPDCYIQNTIIPAALTMNALNTNVHVQTATSILPSDAPGSLSNGTVDSLLYFATTQLLDLDGDGTEDRVDPCPNDAANSCLTDFAMGGSCPAGTVFCTDSAGVAGCRNAQLCWTRRDTNSDCSITTADLNDVGASQLFNVPLPVGPFDP